MAWAACAGERTPPASDDVSAGDARGEEIASDGAGIWGVPGTLCQLVDMSCGHAEWLEYVGSEDLSTAEAYQTVWTFQDDEGDEFIFSLPCGRYESSEAGQGSAVICPWGNLSRAVDWYVANLPGSSTLINAFTDTETGVIDLGGYRPPFETVADLVEAFEALVPAVPSDCGGESRPVEDWCPEDTSLID